MQVRQCMVKFEQKRQTVEASRSQNNVMRRLMAEKACGNLPGIYGRLVSNFLPPPLYQASPVGFEALTFLLLSRTVMIRMLQM